jgi:hypothetical protein
VVTFYTDATGTPAQGHGSQHSQIAMERTVRFAGTASEQRWTGLGALLHPDGSLYSLPLFAIQEPLSGGSTVRVHNEQSGVDEEVDFGLVYDSLIEAGETQRQTSFRYPEEPGVYHALMLVAGAVEDWEWRFLARPSSGVVVLGVTEGEGTYFPRPEDFTGGTGVTVDPVWSRRAAVMVDNHFDITAENRLFGVYRGGSDQTVSISAPNGEFECDTGNACWFTHILDQGDSRFHVDGHATNDNRPLLLIADVRFPECEPATPEAEQLCGQHSWEGSG